MKTIRNFKNMHNETYNFLHTVHIQQSNSKSTEWSACKDWDSVGCEQRLGQFGVRAKIGTVWGASKDWDSVGCEQRLGQCGVRAKIGTGKGGGGMSVDWGILSTSFPGNQIRKI